MEVKRFFFFFAGIGLIIAGIFYCYFKSGSDDASRHIEGAICAQEKKSTEKPDQEDPASADPIVLVEKAVLKPNVIRRKYIGSFEPIQKVVVIARISGNIEKQMFQEGNFVKKDDILFEIEKIRYEAALSAAVARVASCEAQIASVDAKEKQTQARLTYAQNNYNRNTTLYEQGGNLVTKDTVENIKSVLDAQTAEMAAVKAEKLAAQAGLDAAKAELKLARDDMGHTTIRAMISGRIGRVNYTLGNYITPQSGPLATVVQLDPIYLRFSVSEKDFTTLFGNVENLKKSSNILIELAGGEIYKEKGEIAFIDNQMASLTNTIYIWASFRNSKEYLNPGGVATVYLDKKEDKLLPAVKESALLFDGRHHSIYVVGPDNTIEKRQVEPISSDGEYQTLAGGVQEGEVIVIDGTHKIRMIPGPDGVIPPFKVTPTYTPTLSPETNRSIDGGKK